MAQQPGAPSTPRLPFNPPPPAAPSAPTGGPGKPLVIGCLILLVLVGVGLIVGLYYLSRSYDRIFAWSLGRIRDGVQERLPKDLPPDERQHLDDAFGAAESAAGAARGNPAAASRLQRLMLDLAHQVDGTGPLSREQVKEITHTLEQIGEIGKTAPPPARSALPGALEWVNA